MPAAKADPPPPAGSDIVLERLNRLHPKLIDLGLDRVEALLSRLGNPQAKLAPVVHVAGTNGKGSLIAYLRAMLEASGRRVQCYTSPHLVRFHERIRLGAHFIEEAELVRLLEVCEAANDAQAITFFEVTTVAAFLAFAADPADLLLLETGLGGRLDATNVVPDPLLTVLTPISIDHVQFLGGSLREIAREKAGILKAGRPAVVGRQAPEALAVIEARAADLGVPLYRFGQEWRAVLDGGEIVFEGLNGARRYPLPRLLGSHQVDNAGLAIACSEHLEGLTPDDGALRDGLARVDWPARLQRLKWGPLIDRLPVGVEGDWELWLDGGHNAAAGAALAETLSGWSPRPLHLIYGMMNTKAAEDFLRPLGALASSLSAVAIPGEANALTAEAAAAHAGRAGFSARGWASLEAALEAIVEDQAPGRILICGSLYLAGRVLAAHG
jgi:dihydrofolate synthase/folylpolyglutamate synthase